MPGSRSKEPKTSKKRSLKKIATNLPEALLKEATELSGLNQTQAIISGLLELVAAKKRDLLIGMKGGLTVNLNLDKIRQRKKVRN